MSALGLGSRSCLMSLSLNSVFIFFLPGWPILNSLRAFMYRLQFPSCHSDAISLARDNNAVGRGIKNMKSRISTIIFVCGYTGLVHASGNVLPRANSESLGMADATVALASGPAAQIINPANIVDTPGGAIQWEIGTLLGQADASFSRTTAASGARA